MAGQLRTGLEMTGVEFPEHVCAVPGYLHLPDLAMFWQCADCEGIWQVVATRRAPGSPVEFVWVRAPIQPDGPPELERHGAPNHVEGS